MEFSQEIPLRFDETSQHNQAHVREISDRQRTGCELQNMQMVTNTRYIVLFNLSGRVSYESARMSSESWRARAREREKRNSVVRMFGGKFSTLIREDLSDDERAIVRDARVRQTREMRLR